MQDDSFDHAPSTLHLSSVFTWQAVSLGMHSTQWPLRQTGVEPGHISVLNIPFVHTRTWVESEQPSGPSGEQLQIPPGQTGLSPLHAACGSQVPAAVHRLGTPFMH